MAGCASLPQVELDIARSEVAKAYAGGAKVLAPVEYAAAANALHEAELLIHRNEYRQARTRLNQALLHVAKASELAHKKAAELESRRKAAARKKVVEKKPVKKSVVKKKPPKPKPKPKQKPSKPQIVLLDEVTITAGETLSSLAARKDIYADPLLWPLIYKANRDQIKDPQKIFKGQVFTIPRDKSAQEQEAARKEARESKLFQ